MKIAILGGGESGTGAALLAKHLGHEVFLSDGGSLKENYKAELRTERHSIRGRQTHLDKHF